MRAYAFLAVILAALAATIFVVPRGGETLPGRALTKVEIKNLLIENTAIGRWGDDDYRQYFSGTGVTYYAPRGKRSTRGKWRIPADGGGYESWWNGPEDNWERFGVRLTGKGYAWSDAEGTLHPFEMLDGQKLVWDE